MLEKMGKLSGRKQAIVDDGLRGKRTDITARGQERFRAFSEERQTPLETRGGPGGVEWFYEELPDFWHRLECAAAKRICVGRNAAPADDAEALGVCGGLNCRAGFVNLGGWKKSEADCEHFGQVGSRLLSASAEEGLRKRREQSGTVTAGAVGIDAAAVGEALQGRQSVLDNVVAGRAAKPSHEAAAAGAVVRVAPIGMTSASRRGSSLLMTVQASTVAEVHTRLSNGRAVEGQRRILIHCIEFLIREVE